ncbi:MAG: ATP-binding cassette domain-containing protein [Methylobacter sp.]|uniref:ATP-binding cassette domain-containing protein n=1 Tax=Methylobacter sp. TaxID=2051955 RepID=UPI002587256A|nr:ATP-binding cassette domain-containing protein [Methylobacter sp.]MCL7419705.1 ATP-binding cassette domain-containing protein [Methylobacter sp.]
MDKILEVKGLSQVYGPGCELCISSTGPEFETNICPHCGSIVALHDLSFDLYKGEILGIMGESGSGKSTAVKCLYFDQMPYSGSAIFFDEPEQQHLFKLNPAQRRSLRNRRFGMVYQNPNLGLNFDISAGGNIAERLLMSQVMNYSEIRNRAQTLLARTEVLIERMDELPKNFSGGMQQRVQIAKALATRPPLLFLDEVTTGLDLSVQAKILDLILEIQAELDTAMIVVTHDLGVIRLLAGRTLVMKYGRVIESGLTDQILEDPQHAYTQQLVASAL